MQGVLHTLGLFSSSVGGDLSKAESALQRSRGSMKSVLELKEVPEIDGEDTDGSHEHMRIQELATCSLKAANMFVS